jgi:hypothetical protein
MPQVPGKTISGGLSGGAWSLIAAHLGLSGKQLLQMWKGLFTSDKAKQLFQSAAAGGPGLVGHINTLAVVSRCRVRQRGMSINRNVSGHVASLLSCLFSCGRIDASSLS